MINFHDVEPQRYWSFPSNFKGDKVAETKNMIFGGEYVGSRKMDGAFYKFWKDENGKMELLGRNKGVSGDYLNKIDWVPQFHDFFNSLPNGTCLLGELYFPNNEGSSKVTSIMGCLVQKAHQRQEQGQKLHYYIFDVLAWDGESLLKTNIEERITYISDINIVRNTNYNEYIHTAKYYEGEELWKELQYILSINGEGIVITKKGTCYQPGKRSARQTLKIKKELQETIDVVILGSNPPTRVYTGKEIETWKFWEDLQTNKKMIGDFYKDYFNGAPIEPITKNYFNNWAGSLIIGAKKDNKLVPIGSLSGMTEEVLQNWTRYVGAVAEITAMEITKNQNGGFGLRHPKFIQWRKDLRATDTDWYRIFGNE